MEALFLRTFFTKEEQVRSTQSKVKLGVIILTEVALNIMEKYTCVHGVDT